MGRMVEIDSTIIGGPKPVHCDFSLANNEIRYARTRITILLIFYNEIPKVPGSCAPQRIYPPLLFLLPSFYLLFPSRMGLPIEDGDQLADLSPSTVISRWQSTE